MAALDTSAGNVALGQLSALPFKNIIGGPLTASIEAPAALAAPAPKVVPNNVVAMATASVDRDAVGG